MKLYVIKNKVRGKEVLRHRMNLTKREAFLLTNLGNEFTIEDVDKKTGAVWLKVKNETTTTIWGTVDPVSSFRVRDGVGFRRFVELCRSRGLTACGVISDFVEVVNFCPELVESPGGVKVVNVFLGKPRSKWERKLWEERLTDER